MKKIVLGILTILFLFSCGNKEKKNAIAEPVIPSVDDTIIVNDDTIEEEPPIIEEVALPRLKESFDDFIYNFISNKDLQLKRIIFPLPYYKDNTVVKLEESEWQMDSIFYTRPYYTILFNREDDIDLSVDTGYVSVQVEEIFMETLTAKKYYFERINNKWMLEAINEKPLEEYDNRDFIQFFYKFSNDSLFQESHTRDPLKFVTMDPDDDFEVLETTLDFNQWLAFKPSLPKKYLSNISYGQENNSNSNHKIVQLKGIDNGFLNILSFRRRNNNWELYKFEDTSN